MLSRLKRLFPWTGPEKQVGEIVYIGFEKLIGKFPPGFFSTRDQASLSYFLGDEKLGDMTVRRLKNSDPSQERFFTFRFPRHIAMQEVPKLSVLLDGERPFGLSPSHFPPRPSKALSFDDIARPVAGEDIPWLDKADDSQMDLTPDQAAWHRDGVLHLPKLIPDDMVEAYKEARWRLRPDLTPWHSPTVYMHVDACMDICVFSPLAEKLQSLIGEPMGAHLTLTTWESTNRDWHQDSYLNPEHVGGWYAAAWVALEDIHPDSGPFQYVPGSHRWPVLQRELVLKHLDIQIPHRCDWPLLTQGAVSQILDDEIRRRGGTIQTYLPKKGDVLIWHAQLVHRGSTPRVPGTPRRSLIVHYSSIHRRPDFPTPVHHANGTPYFPFDAPLG